MQNRKTCPTYSVKFYTEKTERLWCSSSRNKFVLKYLHEYLHLYMPN